MNKHGEKKEKTLLGTRNREVGMIHYPRTIIIGSRSSNGLNSLLVTYVCF